MSKVEQLSAKHPRPAVKLEYGTAGFRTKANLLDSTMFRAGLLASLRSQYHKGKVIGVMVTASHNPPEDNGVKLIDPMGQMLETQWEPYATKLANTDNLTDMLKHIAESHHIDTSITPEVAIARDSRESGPALIAALKDGLEAAGARVHDFGLFTTPQLHYLVRALNTLKTPNSYGVPTEEGYYKKLSIAYKKVLSGLNAEPYDITIDCANGVGAPKLKEMAQLLEGHVHVTVANDHADKPSMLNEGCGADFVKTNQRLPNGVETKTGKLYASFDGDADRIIFFFVDEKGVFHLLDGDRIASLVASFIGDLVRQTGTELRIGVVQTAYANGSSTEYLTKTLGLPVECTKTGVKHLHAAAEKFDIGVYFEANGHGTVLFDQNAVTTLQTFQVTSPAQKSAIDSLLALSDLINQTVGDAISDLLLVLAILTIKQWSPNDWNECYTDLPNRLMKVEVTDRSMFVPTDAERRLVKPDGLQASIEELVNKYSQGRSFVRPSGTENVVRVYAEAETRTQADELALKVSKLVERF